MDQRVQETREPIGSTERRPDRRRRGPRSAPWGRPPECDNGASAAFPSAVSNDVL